MKQRSGHEKSGRGGEEVNRSVGRSVRRSVSEWVRKLYTYYTFERQFFQALLFTEDITIPFREASAITFARVYNSSNFFLQKIVQLEYTTDFVLLKNKECTATFSRGAHGSYFCKRLPILFQDNTAVTCARDRS